MLKCGGEVKQDIRHHSSSRKMNVMVRLNELAISLLWVKAFLHSDKLYTFSCTDHLFSVQEVHSTGWLVCDK